jgi:hypothetical protein
VEKGKHFFDKNRRKNEKFAKIANIKMRAQKLAILNITEEKRPKTHRYRLNMLKSHFKNSENN